MPSSAAARAAASAAAAAAARAAASADGMPNRVLGVYRKLLRLAGRLPAAERAPAVAQIRTAFRSSSSESAPARVAELLAEANKRVNYLRVVTPRQAGDDQLFAAAAAEGAGRRYVVNAAGELVPADGPGGVGYRATAAGVHSLGSSDIRRHQALNRRFHFMDRK